MFRSIPLYSDYVISEDGTVKRVNTKRGKKVPYIVSPCVTAHGYIAVNVLRDDGKRSLVPVHRLVALTFIGDPPPGQDQVRHLDGDRLNPNVANLAWGSALENSADTIAHGRAAKKLNPDQVLEIRTSTVAQRKLAKKYGVAQATIGAIKNHDTWRHVI